MSNIKIELDEIKIPELTDSTYGKSLKECFDNINKNFKTLSNHDFIKGAQGESLYTATTSLTEVDQNDNTCLTDTGLCVLFAIIKDALEDEDTYNTIKNKIGKEKSFSHVKECLKANDALKDIGNYSLLDYFENLSIIFIKQKDPSTTNDEVYVGALNYLVFKDARFNNEKLSENTDHYKSAIDTSCIVYVKDCKDGVVNYEILHDIPGLYYDTDIEAFCWKLYGTKSGIVAQGPAGKDGSVDGNIRVVYVNLDSDTSEIDPEIKKFVIDILKSNDSSNYSNDTRKEVPITEYLYNGTIHAVTELNDQFKQWDPAFIYVIYDKISYVFFSQISSVTEGKATVTISSATKINTTSDSEIVENTMNRENFRGLHLPIERGEGGNENNKHMIWSSSDNYHSQTDTTKYLNIAPINGFSEGTSTDGVYWNGMYTDAQLNICYPIINLYSSSFDDKKGVIINKDGINTMESDTRLGINCGVNFGGNFNIYSYEGTNFITVIDKNVGEDPENAQELEISAANGSIVLSNQAGTITMSDKDDGNIIKLNTNGDKGYIVLGSENLELGKTGGNTVFNGSAEFNGDITSTNITTSGVLKITCPEDTSGTGLLTITDSTKNNTVDATPSSLSVTTSGATSKLTGNTLTFLGASTIEVADGLNIQSTPNDANNSNNNTTVNISGDLNISNSIKIGAIDGDGGVYADTPIGTIIMYICGDDIGELLKDTLKHWVVCNGDIYTPDGSDEKREKIYEALKFLGLPTVDDKTNSIQIPDFSARIPVGLDSSTAGVGTEGYAFDLPTGKTTTIKYVGVYFLMKYE